MRRLDQQKTHTSAGLEKVNLKIDFENLRMQGDDKSAHGVATKAPALPGRHDSGLSAGSAGIGR